MKPRLSAEEAEKESHGPEVVKIDAFATAGEDDALSEGAFLQHPDPEKPWPRAQWAAAPVEHGIIATAQTI